MSDSLTPGDATDPQAESVKPSVSVLAQYVKDLSFESPKAPVSLQQRDKAPTINITVNVGARALNDKDFEVVLTLEAKSMVESETFFQTELQYAGIFRVAGMKQEHLQPFLLIEGPRMLFPFARQIVADAVRNGGFPPLLIEPIDFVGLYRQNLARAAPKPDEGGPPAAAVN
jgi:preprotein translocase subunit SecB